MEAEIQDVHIETIGVNQIGETKVPVQISEEQKSPVKPRKEKYVIDYVYGFRGEITHNSHFNAQGQVVYVTAALGVILDPPTNTQRFFGGGETSGKSRTVINDTSFHTDHISAIALSTDRRFAVTG